MFWDCNVLERGREMPEEVASYKALCYRLHHYNDMRSPRVVLQGLQARPELNEQTAVLGRYLASAGRYELHFPGTNHASSGIRRLSDHTQDENCGYHRHAYGEAVSLSLR